MFCSSAGPRGPAVMMLVLSATGAPFPLVKTFVVDMTVPYVVGETREEKYTSEPALCDRRLD
jgi:hypothetical protein